VLGVVAPVAVGRYLGVPLLHQVRAVVRPGLVTVAVLALSSRIAQDTNGGGSWPTLVVGVAVTLTVASSLAVAAGLNRRQRARLLGRVRALARRGGAS
jgi:hypothetical protein